MSDTKAPFSEFQKISVNLSHFANLSHLSHFEQGSADSGNFQLFMAIFSRFQPYSAILG
jgi:hypothetical protein